ncbi:MAG: hypothetical protein KO464_08955 [Candidatus Methanofastidiosum sp.]|nr:hypothetical protein [Methanofastidiosum sp.]
MLVLALTFLHLCPSASFVVVGFEITSALKFPEHSIKAIFHYQNNELGF